MGSVGSRRSAWSRSAAASLNCNLTVPDFGPGAVGPRRVGVEANGLVGVGQRASEAQLLRPRVTAVDVGIRKRWVEVNGLAGVADRPPIFPRLGMGQPAHPVRPCRSGLAPDDLTEVGYGPAGRHGVAAVGPAPDALAGDQPEPVAPDLLDAIDEEALPGVDDAAVDDQVRVERLHHDFEGLGRYWLVGTARGGHHRNEARAEPRGHEAVRSAHDPLPVYRCEARNDEPRVEARDMGRGRREGMTRGIIEQGQFSCRPAG